MSFEIGTHIFASSVTPGMVIDINGENVDVEQITEGYDWWKFTTGSGREYKVNYGDRVKLLGWFNAESLA